MREGALATVTESGRPQAGVRAAAHYGHPADPKVALPFGEEGPVNLAFERAVIDAAPKRRITLEALYPCENHVIVEALLFNPGRGEAWSLPWCTILTFADGKIISDRNYLDFAKWPAAETIQPDGP